MIRVTPGYFKQIGRTLRHAHHWQWQTKQHLSLFIADKHSLTAEDGGENGQIGSEEEFVRMVLADQPEPPRYFARMKRVMTPFLCAEYGP